MTEAARAEAPPSRRCGRAPCESYELRPVLVDLSKGLVLRCPSCPLLRATLPPATAPLEQDKSPAVESEIKLNDYSDQTNFKSLARTQNCENFKKSHWHGCGTGGPQA